MSVPVLYEANTTNFFNKGLGTLPDALTAVVTEERNGEFIFEMTYPADGARADLLENNRIIKVDAGHVLIDQRFVIKKTTPQMSEDGKIYIDVYAEHISYITNDLALKPSVTVSGSANDAMQQWQKAIIDSNEITADSDITTSNSTAWTIDKVQTARQALGGVDGSILDVWGGEYLFDNLHISLKKQRGSSANALLAYGRNITSFQQEENIENTCTSIYPYATLNSSSGDTSSLYTIDNYVVDSQYVGNYPNRKILPVDFSSNFENVKVGTKASDASDSDTTVYMTVAEVQSQLKALAQQYITNNDVGIPTVSISVSFEDLSKTSNYADVAPLEQLDLCDIVPVRFTKLGIDTTAKVTHAEWNVLTDSYDKIELGSITPTLGQTLNTLTTVAQAAKQAAQDAQNNATTAWQSADGKTTTFQISSSQDFPTAQHIGDQCYRKNGDDTEFYIWDGAEWKFIVSNKTGQNISNAVDTAMTDASNAVTSANTAVDTANQSLTKAQAGIDAANAAADTANSASSDASSALSKAESAVDTANTAAGDAASATNIANAVQQSVTTLKDGSTMTIAKLENGLALKITKDDMNTALEPYATQSWTSTEISATADEINTSIAAVKKTSDTNTTNVSTLEQRADGFDNSITNLTTTKADQTWTTNQISATAKGINETILGVQTQVSDSAVGTNLIINSGNGWLNDPTKSPNISNSDISVDGLLLGDNTGILKLQAPGSGEFYYRFMNPSTSTTTLYGLIAGQTYTISGLANLTDGQLNFRTQTVNGGGGWSNFTGSQSGDLGVTNGDGVTFTKFSYTFTIPDTATGIYISLQVYNFTNNTSVLSFKQTKLEKGSHATDYSANPIDNATATSVTSLSATVDGLSTTVSKKVDNTTFTTYQNQTATAIAAKVSSTDFNSYRTQTDQAIQQKVSSSDYNSKVTQLSNMIDSKVSLNDITVGGTNLIPLGNIVTATSTQTNYDSTNDIRTITVANGAGGSWGGGLQNNAVTKHEIPWGQSYTYSVEIKTSVDGLIWNSDTNTFPYGVSAWGGNDNDNVNRRSSNSSMGGGTGTKLIPNVWNKVWVTVINSDSRNSNKVSLYDNSTICVVNTTGSTVTVLFRHFKGELGNIPTDYSPAPDDIYSQIQQLSDNINLRVVKNDVINQINISTEGILIAGNKVHITGTTTIDNAVIKSAMIDSISADKITAGTLNAANVNVINLNADNISSGTLTGVSFHQSSSGHDTWIDGNGIHDYDGSGNNAWIQKGILQVYDSDGDGFFMDSGKLELSSYSLWQNWEAVKYGLIELDNDILSLNKSGMHLQGANGVKVDTANSQFTSLDLAGMLAVGKQGSSLNLGADGRVFLGGASYLTLTGGTKTSGTIAVKPYIQVGVNDWPPNGTGGDIGANIFMEANGIWLQSAGQTHINPSGDLWFGQAHINTSTNSNSLWSGPAGGWWMRDYGGNETTIHVQSVSQSSLLSLKTNLNKLDPVQALAVLTNTDIYSYNYKSDLENGISKTYATPVIDDVNTKPQYNTPYDFISADGTGRDDGTILGYAVAAIQELNSKIISLETEIKQLKGAA